MFLPAPLAKGKARGHRIGRQEDGGSAVTVKVIAFVSVKEGQEAAFEEAAATCVAASRAEAGVLHYDLWREAEGERRYVFNELYQDQAAVQAHMGSDHFKAFGLAARDLAAGRPTIVATTPVNVAD
ncbi:putative quinol monooxygenase [Sphingomonas sp. MMS24-JH45]